MLYTPNILANVVTHSITSKLASKQEQTLLVLPLSSDRGTISPDDYYDTEEPSVNFQEFITNSMQAQNSA